MRWTHVFRPPPKGCCYFAAPQTLALWPQKRQRYVILSSHLLTIRSRAALRAPRMTILLGFSCHPGRRKHSTVIPTASVGICGAAFTTKAKASAHDRHLGRAKHFNCHPDERRRSGSRAAGIISNAST